VKVPVSIVTGFLGAGKTSLIRHLLETASEKRIGLIINEFGDLGVDLNIIDGCEIKNCDAENFIELANGCICCTVADDFLPTMTKLLDQKPSLDHILIETSGLALPKPLVKAFNWPEVRAGATVDSVIAVVDSRAVYDGDFSENLLMRENSINTGNTLTHDSPLEEVFEEQVFCADIIVLNKCDLLDQEKQAQVQNILNSHKISTAKILKSRFGRINADLLLGLGAAAEDTLNLRRSHHDGEEDHDHDDFESFVFEFGSISDPKIIEDRLKKIIKKHNILRVKGFVDVLGKEMRSVIQGVGSRINTYYDRPWQDNEQRRTSIVIIGLTGIDRVAIVDALCAD
jgi:cobalamin biosynthesis protein CobW